MEMIKKAEKFYNISTSILFCLYALTALVITIFLPKYNIFFNGWWTLFIILPSLGSLLFYRNKLTSLYTLAIGIILLLGCNDILTIKKCFTILLCLGIILIGINIIKSTIKIPEKKDSNTKYVPLYYAFLGATEERVSVPFEGGTVKTCFGHIILDFSDAKITNNSTLNTLSIFGTTEIILPKDVEVVTKNTNILGGTENLKTSSKVKNKKKLYIESKSILGSTKIK